MSNNIKMLPTVAIRGTVILPGTIVHFDVSRERSIRAVEEAMMADEEIFLLTQRDAAVEEPGIDDLYKVGCIARVKQVVKMPKNIRRVLVEGLDRGTLLSLEREDEYLEAEVLKMGETDYEYLSDSAKEAMLRSLKDFFAAFCQEEPAVSKEIAGQMMEIKDLQKFMDQININMPFDYEEKQKFLEANTLTERYELMGHLLSKEIEIAQIRKELSAKVKEKIDQHQKEYVLREQLKVIREELGEDHTQKDIENFKKAAGKLKASKEIKDKIMEEIARFQSIGMNSPEGQVMRGYIETLLALPWDKASKDSADLKRAKEILDEDHYGLEKVKERIIEFLAVRILNKKGHSPILCLVGPPGTGKTSIGRSIAAALNKKYVRLSLGGVRDEAEIRGHRRTYVGAMPGRIVNGLKQAGVKNPLMVLDEIDKVSSDYKGDVSSALLEVLDAEQNQKFADHYVELPVDLSEVLFLATANDLQTIPRPLLDRMEIIEVSSYTENEKAHIAKEHLIPKQLKAHGIAPEQLVITDGAVKDIISKYTKEAGVRSLERKIGEICRKSARQILEEKKEKITVTSRNLSQFLGNGRYSFQKANETDEVGIVRGLAWTSVGGDALQIEVNLMPGKGEFVLTGQLGDVMKESARTGISYIRSISEEYEIPEDFFQKHDIHIHIPEGAVPKDGPSAGITMATAMLSAITTIPVKAEVAMTGEITLRGRVLPIGGLKEKLLAAKNAGIKTVLVPVQNKVDVAEISKEITSGLRIVYVQQMKEVLAEALAR